MLRCVTQAWRAAAIGVQYLPAVGRGEDVSLLLPLAQKTESELGVGIAAAVEALPRRDAAGAPEAALRTLASLADRSLQRWHHDGVGRRSTHRAYVCWRRQS